MEEMLGERMQPIISLRKFLADYKQTLEELPLEFDESEENIEHMEDECSLDKLSTASDAYVSEFVPGFSEHNRKLVDAYPTEALELKTMQLLKKYKEQSIKNPVTRTRDIFKYVKCNNNMTTTEHLDFYNELLIWVRIYRPARVTHIGRSLEKPVFAEEFVCLGANYLTELRDKISCICNGKRFFDISADPTQTIPSKDTDPGYFFITDTFYNDMRNRNNADYSMHIRNWARKAVGIKKLEFKVAKMEETRFIDLSLSLGFPQLYQHHGNCEHVFTVSQVELLTPSVKCWPRTEYPRLLTFNLFNDRSCHMCGRAQFVFVVEESDRQLHDPAYLCDECFKRYHYVDGKKVGDFKAYRLKDKIVSAGENDFEIPLAAETTIKKVIEQNTQPRSYEIVVRENSSVEKAAEFTNDIDEGFIIEFLDDD